MITFVPGNHHHHYHICQPFCSLRCWGWANTKHLFTLFVSWRSKTPGTANKLSGWHKVPNVSSTSDGFSCHLYCIVGPIFLPQRSISPEGPPTPFTVGTEPRGAPHEVKWFWGIPIITFVPSQSKKTQEGGEQNIKQNMIERIEEKLQIMTQNQSCCRTPHKNYSRRNGTWPGGKSAPPSAGLLLAQSGHSLVWCPPPIRLVCSLLSHSKVI